MTRARPTRTARDAALQSDIDETVNYPIPALFRAAVPKSGGLVFVSPILDFVGVLDRLTIYSAAKIHVAGAMPADQIADMFFKGARR